MWRMAVLVGLVLLAGLSLGCPRLIDQSRAGGPGRATRLAERTPDQSQPIAGQPGESSASEGLLVGPEAPAGAEQPLAGPPAPGDAAEEPTSPLSGPGLPPTGPGAVPGAPPAAGNGTWIDPLDPASVLDTSRAPDRGPGGPGDAALAASLAGPWVVVSVNQQGQGRMVNLEQDKWVYTFAEGGWCSVALNRDGNQWVRDGTWQLVGNSLTLQMGPDGLKRFQVELDDVLPDLCLFREEEGTVYFCVRGVDRPADVTFADSYQTTYDTLALSRASNGSWQGKYGQAGGQLTLYNVGQLAAGSWTQGSNQGCVAIRSTTDGFTGRWWYLSSTKIEGTWEGKRP